MKRVLIADDEPLTRFALRKMIGESFSELEIIGEVDNGIAVVEEAQKMLPDIIFMDIKMPGRTGIEASEIILRDNPQIHIIILTAYDHFDYIQKALEIGVEGYLLKPISKDNVRRKIDEIVKRILLIEAKNKAREALESNVDAVVGMAERDFIDQLIQKRYDEDSIAQYLNFLGHTIASGFFMCIRFQVDDRQYYNSTIARERTRNKVTTAIDRYLPFMTRYIQASPRGNNIILFLYDTESTGHSQKEESVMIAEHLIHKIELVEKCQVAIGIGKTYRNIKTFGDSFDEAYMAVRQLKPLEWLHYEDCTGYSEKHNSPYPTKKTDQLMEKIQLGNPEESMAVAVEIVDEILLRCQSLWIAKEYITQLYYNVRQLIISIINEETIDASMDLVVMIGNAVDTDEIRHLVLTEVSRMIRLFSENLTKGNQVLTEIIYDFAHRHYREDITLDDLAEAIGKSSQYTSKIFKKLFDVNFVDYITGLRMDEAKEHLRTSNMKIRDVALKAGYDDSNYFCRIFKKRTGMTPNEYRRKAYDR